MACVTGAEVFLPARRRRIAGGVLGTHVPTIQVSVWLKGTPPLSCLHSLPLCQREDGAWIPLKKTVLGVGADDMAHVATWAAEKMPHPQVANVDAIGSANNGTASADIALALRKSANQLNSVALANLIRPSLANLVRLSKGQISPTLTPHSELASFVQSRYHKAVR